MAKRRITDQQQRRIHRKHSTSINAAESHQQGETLLLSGQLGPEQRGVVCTRYSNQVDVVTSPTSLPMRCYLRSNLNVVTGDDVIWRPGDPYGVVSAVLPRKTQLDRPDKRGKLRPVAANIDRIVIVVAPEPRPHANLIDRYLVAIEHRGITPILLLNKTDLVSDNTQIAKDLAHFYAELGYETIEVSAKSTQGLNQLTATLSQHTSVFVGQSGVGKSSLINAICPTAETAIACLSKAHAKGRHTTTTANLFFLPGGGRLVDSPGIREFGLSHLDEDNIAEGFIEFRPYLGQCKFRDCRHQNDPGCALQNALRTGKISSQRMQSYQMIMLSLPTE